MTIIVKLGDYNESERLLCYFLNVKDQVTAPYKVVDRIDCLLIVSLHMVICFQESRSGLPKLLDYASCMAHLAVFGILGVICFSYLLP